MYVIIDTETNGLFDFKKPADAEGQPRLAELAMILLDADLNVEAQHQIYIKPEGWEMTEEASKTNGLATEILMEKGRPVSEALNLYSHFVNQGRIIVAHNAQYDCKIMRGELRRAGMPDLFETTKNICTMRGLVEVCKIPPKGGKGGYKFPKLSEACVHFDIKLLGDHTAMGDALTVVQLLKRMVQLGVVPEAKVHYAKEAPERKRETPTPPPTTNLNDIDPV